MPLAALSLAAKPEKPDVTIAVGGKSSLYYLPMAIADRLGYFKAEGLNVESADFAGEPHHVERLVFEFATGWFGSRADGR